MFKKKSQSGTKNVRRPGQALEDSSSTAPAAVDGGSTAESNQEKRLVTQDGTREADIDSADDDDDASAVHRPAKRQRQQNEQSTTTTKPAASAIDAASTAPSLNDPTLISVTSSRSAQPDTSTNAHQHARYAPKQPSTTTSTPSPAAAAPTVSLPSTNPAPSARFGPQRISGYARSISRYDYQPDVCKDWKECGSCGYGDSCKFLHDRGDYKQGWQLEKEWDDEQRKKEAKRKDDEERRARGETVVREDRGGKAGLPFACYICRQKFEQPVVTVCGHYFCERCALQRYVKTSRCAVCGKETQGSFSIARELLKETAVAADGSDGSDDER